MPAHDLGPLHSRPITIKSVEAIPVMIPLAKVMKMGSSELTKADNLLVRIEAADGTVGWGEAASAPGMSRSISVRMIAGIIWKVDALPTPLTKNRNRNMAKNPGQLPTPRK